MLMKKILLLGAFVAIGFFAYAQEENNPPAAAEHGKAVSELATTTEATGSEKGAFISSAARAKALTHANANAKFIRGDARPENANNAAQPAASGQPATIPVAMGKPAVLPPVTPPTMGKPAVTPVGKPTGVPVGKPN